VPHGLVTRSRRVPPQELLALAEREARVCSNLSTIAALRGPPVPRDYRLAGSRAPGVPMHVVHLSGPLLCLA